MTVSTSHALPFPSHTRSFSRAIPTLFWITKRYSQPSEITCLCWDWRSPQCHLTSVKTAARLTANSNLLSSQFCARKRLYSRMLFLVGMEVVGGGFTCQVNFKNSTRAGPFNKRRAEMPTPRPNNVPGVNLYFTHMLSLADLPGRRCIMEFWNEYQT